MRSEWHDVMATGWEAFDREHRELVFRLGVLLSAVNTGDLVATRSATDDFIREVGAHFAHEERMMQANAYGQLARHKEAHDLFIADVGEHEAMLREGITPEFRRWATGRVLEWFRFHIAANDVALGTFLVGQRRACRLRDAGDEAPRPGRPAAKRPRSA